MNFGQVASNLTLFLIVGLFLPATVIVLGGIALFPDVIENVHFRNGFSSIAVLISAIVLVAAMHGGLAHLFDLIVFDHLWRLKVGPIGGWPFKNKDREETWKSQYSIIGRADALGLNYAQYSQAMSLYVFFVQTSFWLFVLSLTRLIWSAVGHPIDFSFGIAAVLLGTSIVSLLFLSPAWKKSTLDILESLQDVVEKEYIKRYPE